MCGDGNGGATSFLGIKDGNYEMSVVDIKNNIIYCDFYNEKGELSLFEARVEKFENVCKRKINIGDLVELVVSNNGEVMKKKDI